MILAYSSYSTGVYDVTTGHMTLRFEIFWRETANWQEGNRQVWSGKIHNCAESSNITTCMCIQVYKYALDIQEHTEDTIGMSKVGYVLTISHIWCS